VAERGGISRVVCGDHSDLWPLFLAVGGPAYAKCVRVAWESGAADKQFAELRRSFADVARAEAPGTSTLSEREAVLCVAQNAAERIEPLQRIRARLRRSPGPRKPHRPSSYHARMRRP
jgi:hypothetical protein